jgi:hypothetical protein
VKYRVVLAPSGAGKSHAAARGLVVDGDHLPAVRVVYRDLVRAFGEKWWDRPDYKDRVQPLKQSLMHSAFEAELRAKPSKAVATAETTTILGLLKAKTLAPGEILAWAPSAQTITERQAARASKTQPLNNLAKNEAWRAGFMKQVADARITVIESDYLPDDYNA